MKRCSTCGLMKGVDDFFANRSKPSGLSDQCKECCKLHSAARKVARGLAKADAVRVLVEQRTRDGKACTKCNVLTPLFRFPDCKGRIDGKASHCIDCKLAERRQRYSVAPDKVLDRASSYREASRADIRNRRLAARSAEREQLADPYVVKLLTQRSEITPADVPADLVDMKRQQLSLRRVLKKCAHLIATEKEDSK